MNTLPCRLDGLLLLRPRIFSDDRGYFLETWSAERYAEAGIDLAFVQDNASYSKRGVLRGMHWQAAPHAQGKLVSVLHGEVFDVAVDVRPQSDTFGQWEGFTLSAENGHQLWIPPGFAHGFVVTSEDAVFHYKCTEVYTPEAERSLRWDDPTVGIEWPVSAPLLSGKDAEAPLLGARHPSPPRDRSARLYFCRVLSRGNTRKALTHQRLRPCLILTRGYLVLQRIAVYGPLLFLIHDSLSCSTTKRSS